MTSKIALALVLVATVPLVAEGGKKKPAERAMLEKMDAVPCGAKQKGIAGLGSLWASVGITKMSSDEKLCPEYLLRTDDMEYHIRPADYKHLTVLPVGHEIEFKIKKNRMLVKVPDGESKERAYEVVAMKPTASDQNAQQRPSGQP